ncbi:M67 family metallopeptidase [Erythrobacter sp. WH131]|uniref:M67 family metallopeptidase n=2 Tax=Erythrobacter ani TaxID=2827235 RepID=A0ABS6SJC0_9SPHN|nr:M67 family metallopeptidase [Erythrobacter ani]
MEIEVTRDVIAAMRAAAIAAHPREACGILTGGDRRITALVETANVHTCPQANFEIDPQALIDTHRSAREGCAQIIGYFHSHPTGAARPSQTDREMAAHDGKLWAIVAGDELMVWEDREDGFRQVPYSVA